MNKQIQEIKDFDNYGIKEGKYFQTTLWDNIHEAPNTVYYKIVTIRKNKYNDLVGFYVQKCEFKQKNDTTEKLRVIDEKTFYYKYISLHWLYGHNLLLSKDDLTRKIE